MFRLNWCLFPFQHGPDFSPEKTWAELSKNIKEIQNHNAANLSFEENHRFAYNMVLHRSGDQLYNGVKQLVIENLENLASDVIFPAFTSTTTDLGIQNTEEEALLKALRRVWDDHTSNMHRLGQILKYMDRVHTQSAHVPQTHDMGLELFLNHIVDKPSIKSQVVSAILSQVQHERDGYVINRSAMKECVDIFLGLEVSKGTTVYKHDLEPIFLEKSEVFYQKEGEHLATSCDTPEFLRLVQGRFDAEELRTHHYLSSQTTHPLLQILKDNLLTPHLENVIAKGNSGLDVMIDNSQFDDLARLYRLCLKVPTGLPILRSSLKSSIVRRGKEINSTSLGEDFVDVEDETLTDKSKGKGKAKAKASGIETAINWVQDVLNLKDKFDLVWRASFDSNRDVESMLNEAFASFVNLNQKCSEFISLFIDDHLRRGLKGKTEVEVDLVLDKTTTIFRFILEKDVFERYYKGHLAKRLLQGRSVSDDAERGMLAKLKVESGVQFTQKMEGMFNDMKISADTTKEYLDHLSKTTAPEIELNITIMTSNAWPLTHSTSPCMLPPEMSKACKSFEKFYLGKHSGRRLTWQLSLGNADVVVQFRTREHELNVSTFALVILLLFQNLADDDFLTYSYIKEATQIDEVELKRHLQSLASGKYKILKKHPPGRDVNPDDTFSFNNDFTSPMKKIKVPTISSKVESTEERKETRDRIEEERKHWMEACIVRIMKSRKQMSHNDLVSEVTQQLASKFQPEPLTIKKRIELLIEKEYLDRCEDRRSYRYLVRICLSTPHLQPPFINLFPSQGVIVSFPTHDFCILHVQSAVR
ncbi:ubiquitin ligase SCF complex subunit Cullin [Gymnopilus junonius]|uniref:Ubiquitin ligase SCF complex subunit Cullin n=1 Tax=Gymnopilus junonius TaxID=109634 RepID=A0A9P5TS66_GYMJU|nr:ubiquitin ligase SCF complex subunit Cullin [Gymnopilus junonius]